MKQGETITVHIDSINSEGEGVARVGSDGFVVFVQGALLGETVLCRIARLGKKYAAATAIEILETSSDRTAPRCKQYELCGGCNLQHVSYSSQVEMKGRILAEALGRIGRINYARKIDCEPSPDEWEYRNKTTLPFRRANKGDGRVVCGYYERRTHNIVPFEGCAVLRPLIGRLVCQTAAALSDSGLRAYDESSKTGEMRYLAVRSGEGEKHEEVLSGIVVARNLENREFGRLRHIYQELGTENREMSGAVLNVNSAPGNFVWGPVNRVIHGRGLLDERLERYKLRVDMSSFFQINPAQAERMFGHVRGIIEKIGVSSLLEFYSGVGSLTVYLADVVGKIDAVEEMRPSVRLLKENLELNGISNVRAIASSAERFMRSAENSTHGRYDAIVLDPPRTGCDEKVIEGIRRVKPAKVVYVSCNPATLARDVSRISEGGMYEIEDVSAFDMFPQTSHVEAVCVMGRVQAHR
ncbi:MAG: 23S rRNA (uracil(1939)-C(5))-methyltransferase RlmD [Synergistaceae bacterium]|jgi:23S rRNA (uracil1939-C5)-methyltransferase|nr:23S rRNA (uracil(1939)-C(5))-methyltransferase RlmD [Synergistaceae bacterium]